MRLRYTKRALSDLDRILSYTAEHSQQGAARLSSRLERVASDLALHPHTGRATNRAGLRVRFVGDYPYLIFYRIVGRSFVSIVHIRHAARRPFAR